MLICLQSSVMRYKNDFLCPFRKGFIDDLSPIMIQHPQFRSIIAGAPFSVRYGQCKCFITIVQFGLFRPSPFLQYLPQWFFIFSPPL